jgi:hypothetical protein
VSCFSGVYAKIFLASKPKHTTSANVALPGFCVVVIAPDVETVATEGEADEADGAKAKWPEEDVIAGAVPVDVTVEVIVIELYIVIVVVPVVVVARRLRLLLACILTNFFSRRFDWLG